MAATLRLGLVSLLDDELVGDFIDPRGIQSPTPSIPIDGRYAFAGEPASVFGHEFDPAGLHRVDGAVGVIR